jgi:hypothetical protein
MATEPKLVRYGSGRYVPAIVGDPGPIPQSTSEQVMRSRLRRRALELDEAVDRTWFDLVRQVRGTRDLQVVAALERFRIALVQFHTRDRRRRDL